MEENEIKMQQRNEQQQQQQLEAQQSIAQEQARQKQEELSQKERANIRDNETRIAVAQLQAAYNTSDGLSEEARASLSEKARQFDERIALDKDKLLYEKKRSDEELAIKKQSLNKNS